MEETERGPCLKSLYDEKRNMKVVSVSDIVASTLDSWKQIMSTVLLMLSYTLINLQRMVCVARLDYC